MPSPSINLALMAAAAAILAGCAQIREPAGGECGARQASPGGTTEAARWRIGPVFGGKSRSVGMPRQPAPHPDGWSFDFPQPDWRAGHVHYVTFNHGPLVGARQIRMRYRIEAEPGVRFVSNVPTIPASLTLYFQRKGDSWDADPGEDDTFRWYASFASAPLAAGEHEVVAPLDSEWTAVQRSRRSTAPEGFRRAIEQTQCVGVVFGGGDGLGHGAHATGPARFVLLGYSIE